MGTVYTPIWRALEVEQLWLNLGDMVFGDIQKYDAFLGFILK